MDQIVHEKFTTGHEVKLSIWRSVTLFLGVKKLLELVQIFVILVMDAYDQLLVIQFFIVAKYRKILLPVNRAALAMK